MGDTKIEWTNKTWNPVRGCSVVSEGCRNCYAMNFATRFVKKGEPYEGLAYRNDSGAHWSGRLSFVQKHLEDPLKWRAPARIFVNSMSDLFHESVETQWLNDIFGIMALAHWHTFQVLTKRPERALSYLANGSHGVIEQFQQIQQCGGIGPRSMFRALDIKRRDGIAWQWPLPNVWLGVSVEDQKTADERIPLLLQTPAAVRWISAEPLLDRIDLSVGNVIGGAECRCGDFVVGEHGPYGEDPCRVCRCKGVVEPWTRESNRRLDWVVVGGESGAGARPMYVNSARSIIQQCQAAAVPVFMKQLGVWPSISAAEASGTRRKGTPGDWYLRLQDKKGGDINEWPMDLRVREFPGQGI